MNDEIETLPPIRVKINWMNQLKLFVMVIVSFVLWFALIIAGLNIFTYYINSILTKGVFDSETLKYSAMVAVGAYFCLIIDKNKIDEALNVKRNLKFITIDKIKK